MATDPRPTVLVVDDDPTFANDLSVALKASGYRVFEAADVRSAFDVVATGARIDLALVDLNLPDNSGLVIVHTMNQQERHPKILAITAVMSDLHLEIATYMGADRAIRKFPLLRNAALNTQAWKKAVADLLPPPTFSSGAATN